MRLLAPLDKSGDPDQLARNMHLCMDKEDYVIFRWLLDLLTRVAELQEVNKMTPSNLGSPSSPLPILLFLYLFSSLWFCLSHTLSLLYSFIARVCSSLSFPVVLSLLFS